MLKFHRGERRYQNRRLFKRFWKEEERTYFFNRTYQHRYVKRRVNTRTLCSCSPCCTPRKTYGNAKYARTRQEQRFIERFNDSL